MMFPAKMRKIMLFLPKANVNDTTEVLGRLESIQLERINSELQGFMSAAKVERGEIGGYAQTFRSVEQMLPKAGSDYVFEFRDVNALLRKAKSIKAVGKIVKANKQIEQLNLDLSGLSYESYLSECLAPFRYDLSILNGEHLVSFLVSGLEKQLSALDESLKSSDGIAVFKLNPNLLVTIEKSKIEELVSRAQPLKLKMEAIPAFNGTPKDMAKMVALNKKALARRKKELEKTLLKLSIKNRALISAMAEGLEIEEKKNELAGRLGYTDSVAVLEGWVPIKSLEDVSRAVDSVTKGRFLIYDLKSKDIAPTKFENKFPVKLFEFFIKFYSIPRSNEFDPTMMFAIAFPIFFGLMTGDVGYGAAMIVIFGLIMWKLTSKGPTFNVPRKISKFVHTIMSNSALLKLSKAVIPGAMLGIVFGVIFNNYFGFHLPYTALFNPELSLGTLLLIAGWIGVFMVSSGFVLGAINRWMVNDRKRAVGRIGWLAIALGITFVGLGVLEQQPISLYDFTTAASLAGIIGGLAAVLVSEGFEALLELPSIISHILSYTRIVGILLSSVILAEVINTVFLGTLSGGVGLIVFGCVILVMGQLFNLMIAIFESGIQGARLIYVEFFSKFYTGNGAMFAPFKISRKRTVIKSDPSSENKEN